MESWVDLTGYIRRWFTYGQSPIQVLTRQCTAGSRIRHLFIKSDALTTTLPSHKTVSANRVHVNKVVTFHRIRQLSNHRVAYLRVLTSTTMSWTAATSSSSAVMLLSVTSINCCTLSAAVEPSNDVLWIYRADVLLPPTLQYSILSSAQT